VSQVGCADAGYADTEELNKIDQQGILVVVPSQPQGLHWEEEKPFSKARFRYDQQKDCYVCPEGKELHYVGIDRRNSKKDYRISDPGICQSWVHFGKCTSAKLGRKIEPTKRTNRGSKLSTNKTKRSMVGVRRGWSYLSVTSRPISRLLALCCEGKMEPKQRHRYWQPVLRRMMTILGITGLIEKLRALPIPA